MGWYQTAWAAGELYAVTVLSGTHVVCISLGPGAVLWTPERRGWYLWTLVISSPGKRARKKVPILSLAHTLPLHLSKGISYLYKHTVTEKALCYWPDFLEKMYTCIKFFPPLGKMFTKLNLRSIAFSSCWFLIFFFFFSPFIKVMVLLSGVIAFLVNLSIYWIIGNTSPVTYPFCYFSKIPFIQLRLFPSLLFLVPNTPCRQIYVNSAL